MQVGVFIPIGSRGWLISTTSPTTMPSFDLNRSVVQRAEFYGLDFALSMVKLRGYPGPSECSNIRQRPQAPSCFVIVLVVGIFRLVDV
jgi:hypothetical protein